MTAHLFETQRDTTMSGINVALLALHVSFFACNNYTNIDLILTLLTLFLKQWSAELLFERQNNV